MKLLIITDAWEPQVNGVVRTYQNTINQLSNSANHVEVVHPYMFGFKRVRMPGYSEIELVINPWKMKQKLWVALYENWHIHIATEGPLGLYARLFLRRNNFTTCYHTQFPEFFEKRTKLPASLFYPFFRWFHNRATTTMVPTAQMIDYLSSKGFTNLSLWSRGVNTKTFNPVHRGNPYGYILCVSRVSHEKGLDDFCKLDYPKKVLVGDGPYLNTLKAKYKDVDFVGMQQGMKLASYYANADCFVFPSKVDTFGIVLLEAIASGTPIASYETAGPLEVVEQGINGYISDNLQSAVDSAVTLDRDKVLETSKQWSWEAATKQFSQNLTNCRG